MNEVVPSGVLLQRLIQNSHTDILNREKNNDRFMHLYHIGTYWVAFERSACRLCGLFPKSELSLFCVLDCPEYVVMASVPVDEVEGCFRKHVVLCDGVYHKILSDNLLAARDYYRWHDMAVRMVFL